MRHRIYCCLRCTAGEWFDSGNSSLSLVILVLPRVTAGQPRKDAFGSHYGRFDDKAIACVYHSTLYSYEMLGWHHEGVFWLCAEHRHSPVRFIL